MSDSNEHEDLLSIINLLAGAAQAGCKGIMAQAALNVILASEAVVRSRKMELDQSIQDQAMAALNEAQSAFYKASTVEGAMEEAKQDIIDNNQKPYDPSLKKGPELH